MLSGLSGLSELSELSGLSGLSGVSGLFRGYGTRPDGAEIRYRVHDDHSRVFRRRHLGLPGLPGLSGLSGLSGLHSTPIESTHRSYIYICLTQRVVILIT